MTKRKSGKNGAKSPPANGHKTWPKPPGGKRKPTMCSRVSNGKDVLPGVDGRSAVARRYYDIQTAIIIDQGGADQLSEARLQLVRRFAAAAVMAEQMEAALANGKQIDISEHARLCSTLVRVARRIGVDRIAKDVTPTLSQILEEEFQQNEAAE